MQNIENLLSNGYRLINKLFAYLTRKNMDRNAYDQFVRHYFVGGIGTIMNFTIFNFLVYCAGMEIKAANAVNYSILIITTFLLQKYFTYRAGGFSAAQPLLFLVNALLYFLLDTTIITLLAKKASLAPFLCKFFSIGLLTPLSFISQKYLVFRRNND